MEETTVTARASQSEETKKNDVPRWVRIRAAGFHMKAIGASVEEFTNAAGVVCTRITIEDCDKKALGVRS